MRQYSLALLGFGNVGRALARLLHDKRPELRERYGFDYRVTGVAARRIGWLSDPAGLDVPAVLDGHHPGATPWDSSSIHEWLSAARADVLFENTSMNPHTGQPAIDYLKAGLEHGAHVITANKGPVVHAYQALMQLAEERGRRFMFEASVMGGAPVFSLFRALPGANLLRFRGVLNSTTNMILTEIEQGRSFDQAVRRAQELGVAETDPSADVDGWDAAVKVAALATVLMGVPIGPAAVAPVGIRDLSPERVQAARREGRPYKLVCRGERAGGTVRASVRPEQVDVADPLAAVTGTDSIVVFELDTLHGLTVSERDPDAITTAYGPLADFITVAQGA